MSQKEEILSEATGIPVEDIEFSNEVQIIRPSEALEAMQQFADQEERAFAEWIIKNKWQVGFDRWHKRKYKERGFIYKTTDQLYQEYCKKEEK